MKKITTFFKQLNYVGLIISFIMLLTGILFAALRTNAANIIWYIISTALLIIGMVFIITSCFIGLTKIKYEFQLGFISLILSVIAFATVGHLQGYEKNIIKILLGSAIIIDAITRFKDAIVLANKKTRFWWAFLIISGIYIILGSLTIFLKSSDSVYLAIGVFLIIVSCIDVLIIFCFSKKLHDKNRNIKPKNELPVANDNQTMKDEYLKVNLTHQENKIEQKI